MIIVKRDSFHWDKNNDLRYKSKVVASLVPCKEYPDQWHIKFGWRDVSTPEFFNITNAHENARRICRKHMEETPYQPHWCV